MIYLVVVVLLFVAFVLGKVYGARVEASAIAEALRLRSYIGNEAAAAYKVIIADIRAKEATVFTRLKKYL